MKADTSSAGAREGSVPSIDERAARRREAGLSAASPGGIVGVYDSGVGGLSVLRAVRDLAPAEPLAYVADTAYAPYGERTAREVVQRALAVARYFVSRGAKAMVIACNTATTAAVAEVRARHPGLVVIGTEPAVKPAARLTRSGVIGVLATTGTLASPRFAELAQREAPEARILLAPCPQWVLMVERGVVDGDAALEQVRAPVRGLLEQGADVLVLGCTHFPFLTDAIRACAGAEVPVLETGPAVARQLQRQLESRGLAAAPGGMGNCELVASGDPVRLSELARRLVGVDASAASLPAPYR